MPVSDAALRVELERALGGRVTAVTRRPLAYRSSFGIEELEVRLEDGPARRLVVKDLSPAALTPEGAAAKPAFLLDPGREIAAYRDVLEPLGIEAPRLLGSVADARAGRFWLLLERIDGTPLWQVGDWRAWERAAAWLAGLHLCPLPAAGVLLRYDDGWLETWLARAIAFAPEGALDRVARGFDRVRARLRSWPRAFLHGEFYPSNVLVEGGAESGRLRVVDWEMAGIGPGVLDLAALTAGRWDADRRDGLVRAYHRAWSAGGGPGSEAQLIDALEHARLAVALQWLGWSRDWAPPAEHRHDWLREALAAADRLDL